MSPPAPQPAKDPFADLGGSFALGSTPSAQEALYSSVDMSKVKKPAPNQVNTDMFGMFDNQTSTSGSNGYGSNTASNKTSDQVNCSLRVDPLFKRRNGLRINE